MFGVHESGGSEKIIVEGEFIKLLWEDHAVLINVETNLIFLDGSRIKTSTAEPFMSEYMKKENLPYPKRAIRTVFSRNFAYKVTIGVDSRIFFLQFDKVKLREFRAKPKMVWSWWDNKKNKEKLFYEKDLKNPVWRMCYE